jgi:predicted alpha/beta superfamily hydrolase
MYSANEIQLAFQEMENARVTLYNCAEMELDAREDLKSSEAAILVSTDPKELGSNETARMATIRARTMEERRSLEKYEKEKRSASLSFELASMKVDCIKWVIRATQTQ